jgi:exodeoxyribonuclease VII small subunit
MQGRTHNLTYEENIKKLDSLVSQLEKGELPLEAALTCFEEGIGLIRVCQNQLERAAERIQILSKEEGL